MSEYTTSPSLSDISAVMGNNGSGNNWMNNPFMYLIWLAYLGGNGFGFGKNNSQGVSDVETSAKLNALSQQISDNQSTNTLNTAIQGNHDYLHDFSNAVNMGFAGTNAAINNAIQTGIIGNKDIQASILSQTNTMQSRIDQLANGVQTGFAQVGYAQAQQTNELSNAINAGTQRIVDMMCSNTTQALRDKVFEYSQAAQTASIVGQLKNDCGCNS